MISGGGFKLGMAYLPGESNKPKLIRGDDFPSRIITKKTRIFILHDVHSTCQTSVLTDCAYIYKAWYTT